jgi:hypothetical protein
MVFRSSVESGIQDSKWKGHYMDPRLECWECTGLSESPRSTLLSTYTSTSSDCNGGKKSCNNSVGKAHADPATRGPRVSRGRGGGKRTEYQNL